MCNPKWVGCNSSFLDKTKSEDHFGFKNPESVPKKANGCRCVWESQDCSEWRGK